jgi:hypothetical protein
LLARPSLQSAWYKKVCKQLHWTGPQRGNETTTF